MPVQFAAATTASKWVAGPMNRRPEDPLRAGYTALLVGPGLRGTRHISLHGNRGRKNSRRQGLQSMSVQELT